MRDAHRHGILVTGGTGNVGSEVCRHLAGAGRPVFGTVIANELDGDGRPTQRVVDRLHGAEPRVFDFTDAQTWPGALAGVDTVFLMRPPHISRIRSQMYPFMRYMAVNGIRHVVFLSVQGAEKNRLVPHHTVEQVILELEIPYTFVRPSFFMQNLTTTHLAEIRDERRIFVPAGDGATNFIDVRDIGELIASALGDPDHLNQAYTVTGPERLTYHQVSERLSRILGMEIAYEPARMLPFLHYQRSQGRRLGHALVMYALYSVTRMGKAGETTDTFYRIVGRPPTTLDAFISDFRDLFLGGPTP